MLIGGNPTLYGSNNLVVEQTSGGIRVGGISKLILPDNTVTDNGDGSVSLSVGIQTLNGNTEAAQTLQIGTAGTDFNITSVAGVHTFNIPNASTTARGLVTTGNQTFLGTKVFQAVEVGDGTGAAIFRLNGSAGGTRSFLYRTGGSNRWAWDMVTNETGGNSGSNMRLVRHDDTGTVIGEVLRINRSTGFIAFGSAVTASEQVDISNGTLRIRALGTGVLKSSATGVVSSGTIIASDVSDFSEAVDDRVDALIVAGSGIGKSYNDAGNALTIRVKRSIYIPLCLGFTPAGTGADVVEVLIPFSPADGTTSITWNFRRAEVVVGTPSAGTSTFQIERSTAAGAFAATNILTSALSISGATTYKANTTGFAVSQCNSGDRLRFNFSALDATHAAFSIYVLLEES